MHPLIPIEDLAKLTDAELASIEVRLRDLVLCPSLDHADRERCAASLSNAVFVISLRGKPLTP